ncbi:MAG: S8 family serine peptidase [Balneola sp.]
MINSVNKKNAFIIYPSGNKGNGTVLSPGIHPEVFCVGAIDKNGNIAPFSGRMYDEDGNCLKPEVCALGADVEVELEDGSKHVVSGTSFACAQVAGVAAALFEANPKATVNDIKMALIESCTPAEGSRFGNINPEKALELIKTKVPYQEQFETIPEPEWFNEQYIDYRLISQCNRARKNNKDVEGLIVGEDTNALIKRLKEEMSEYISEYNPFINFDMAHIIAKPEFYDALFKQPDLEVASAVDINYFDM